MIEKIAVPLNWILKSIEQWGHSTVRIYDTLDGVTVKIQIFVNNTELPQMIHNASGSLKFNGQFVSSNVVTTLVNSGVS